MTNDKEFAYSSLKLFSLAFQVLAEFGGGHAGMMPEEMAEVKLAGEAQLAGDVLDGKPLVREEQAGLIEPRALDVFVNSALAGFLEGGTEAGIADLADDGEFAGLPI